MPAATSRRTSSSSALLVIVTAYLIFIVLGFPDGMLGIAWPSIMGTFGLQNAQMGTLLLASTLGFLITSFNVGRLIGWFGITNLLIAANVLRAAGLLGMGLAPEWPLLVASAFFFGLGSGAIDGGLNTYFAMNLPSPRLMNWLHASFGLGATVGPLMMTTLLSIGGVWRWGYLIVAAVQVGMGLLVWARASVWQARTDTPAADSPATRTSSRATLARPIVWVNIAIFFCYAGVEVTAGNWSYSLFTEARGVAVAVAGFWASLYWGSFTLGRFFFGIVADRFAVIPTVRAMSLTAIAAAACIWWNPVDWVSFAALIVLGFAMAPVFPLLITATPLRLGSGDANNAIGFQVAAASLGIGLLPGLAGFLADQLSLEIVGPFMVGVLVIMAILHEVAVRYHQ